MRDKKKLYRIIGFPLIVFLLLFSFSCLVDFGVRRSQDEGFKKVNNICTGRVDPDIIAFGSSVGEVSFNSNLVSAGTGLDVYNSCIDGTNFEQCKSLIEEYNLYSSKKSLVLLFEAYFSMVKLPGISSIERFAAYLNDPVIYDVLYNIDPKIVWKSRYIPLYKNTVVDHTYYKASFDGWRSYLLKSSQRDSLHGFLPHYVTWQADQDALLDAMKPFKIVVDKTVLADYIELVRGLRQKGKRVIIVLPPLYERLYKEKTDFGPLEAALDSVSKLTGCGLIDFIKSPLSAHKDYFYNTNHLNYSGAAVFSSLLVDSLKRMVN